MKVHFLSNLYSFIWFSCYCNLQFWDGMKFRFIFPWTYGIYSFVNAYVSFFFVPLVLWSTLKSYFNCCQELCYSSKMTFLPSLATDASHWYLLSDLFFNWKFTNHSYRPTHIKIFRNNAQKYCFPELVYICTYVLRIYPVRKILLLNYLFILLIKHLIPIQFLFN